jgi:hypothetical protein
MSLLSIKPFDSYSSKEKPSGSRFFSVNSMMRYSDFDAISQRVSTKVISKCSVNSDGKRQANIW